MVVFFSSFTITLFIINPTKFIVDKQFQSSLMIKPRVLKGLLEEDNGFFVQVDSTGAYGLFDEDLDYNLIESCRESTFSSFIKVVKCFLYLVTLQVELSNDFQ